MSNEKLSIQDLVDAIAQRTGYSKKKSEDFLRIFQATVEEALIKDGIVKVKGFGTFKLVWNEARKSVNVQTGQEYIIPGHNKVSFVPEASVKEYINEEMESVGSRVKPEINPLDKLNEQAQEIKALMSELNNVKPDTSGDNTPIEIPEPPAILLQEKENKTAQSAAEKAPTPENVIAEAKATESKDARPSVAPTATATAQANNVGEQAAEPHTAAHEREIPVKKKKKGWILAIAIALVVIVAGGVVYTEIDDLEFFFTHLVDSNPKSNKPAVATATPQAPAAAAQSQEQTTPDTLTTAPAKPQVVEKKAPAQAAAKVEAPKANNQVKNATTSKNGNAAAKTDEKPSKSKTSVFDKPRVYKTFIGTEEIEKGSHLTLIAQKHYGFKTFWVYIYEANKDKIPNPESLPAGFKVKIPKLDPELIDLKNPKCIKYAQQLEAKYVHK